MIDEVFMKLSLNKKHWNKKILKNNRTKPSITITSIRLQINERKKKGMVK